MGGALCAATYSYLPGSDFLVSLSNTVGGALCAATYSYLPGSDFLVSLSNTVGGALCAATTRTYEPNRNLITQILNTAGTNVYPALGGVISQFNYANDALGRRTRRVDDR